jgi:hypothetical protein
MLFRRKKNPKQPRVALTPESLQGLHDTQKLTPTYRRLFAKASQRADRDARRTKERLQAHDRSRVALIPLVQHDRVLAQVGLRRSLTAFCLFGLPLLAVILLALHHGGWGALVLALVVTGVWTCKKLDAWQIERMELNDLELKTLRKIATADSTARAVFVRWKQSEQPFAQKELQLVEDWLSVQNEVRKWRATERLLVATAPQPRRFSRRHRR